MSITLLPASRDRITNAYIAEPKPWRAFVRSSYRGFGNVIGRFECGGQTTGYVVVLDSGREIQAHPACVGDATNVISL